MPPSTHNRSAVYAAATARLGAARRRRRDHGIAAGQHSSATASGTYSSLHRHASAYHAAAAQAWRALPRSTALAKLPIASTVKSSPYA